MFFSQTVASYPQGWCSILGGSQDLAGKSPEQHKLLSDIAFHRQVQGTTWCTSQAKFSYDFHSPFLYWFLTHLIPLPLGLLQDILAWDSHISSSSWKALLCNIYAAPSLLSLSLYRNFKIPAKYQRPQAGPPQQSHMPMAQEQVLLLAPPAFVPSILCHSPPHQRHQVNIWEDETKNLGGKMFTWMFWLFMSLFFTLTTWIRVQMLGLVGSRLKQSKNSQCGDYLAHCTGAEKILEQSNSASMTSITHLHRAGWLKMLSGGVPGSWVPVCLATTKSPDCVVLCFCCSCISCIQRTATRESPRPLCRQSFDQALPKVHNE